MFPGDYHKNSHKSNESQRYWIYSQISHLIDSRLLFAFLDWVRYSIKPLKILPFFIVMLTFPTVTDFPAVIFKKVLSSSCRSRQSYMSAHLCLSTCVITEHNHIALSILDRSMGDIESRYLLPPGEAALNEPLPLWRQRPRMIRHSSPPLAFHNPEMNRYSRHDMPWRFLSVGKNRLDYSY